MTGAALPSIRDLLLAAEEEVTEAWTKAEDESFDSAAHAMLDRITQVGMALVEREQFDDLDLVVETFARLFAAAGEMRPPAVFVTQLATPRQAMRWYDIVSRTYVIGALAVELKKFGAVRPLVLQQPNESRQGRRYWLRDTVTALARVHRFEKKSLLVPIPDFVAERPVLFTPFRKSKDEVLNCLCQFDFLQCVVSIAETGDIEACYPNFGIYYKERTEPIIVDLVTGGKSRQVAPQLDDPRLASMVAELDGITGHQFFEIGSWSDGQWDDKRVPEFLARYAPRGK